MQRQRIAISVFLVLMGLLIASIALGIVPIEESKIHAPRWVVGLSGILLVAVGIAAGIGKPNAVASMCAGVFVIGMTVLTGWIAIFGSGEYFSGDLPFLSRQGNIILSRVIFGAVSAMGLAISVVAIRKILGKDDA
jgi:hypothetical protein